MSAEAPSENKADPQRRAFWLKTLHQWHWISSALCLIGMVLFAATGITLNHAGQIEAKPVVTTKAAVLPEALLATLEGEHAAGAPVPDAVADWLSREQGIHVAGRDAEWSDGELYVGLPRPGGDAWVTLDTATGDMNYESTDRGWVSWLNDLHKGRNTGAAWTWFIDVFAVACLVFCLSGLLLLQLHGGNRPATWPVVGLGLVVPVLLILLFIH